MKLIVKDDYEAMSKTCLHMILGCMLQDKHVNLSITSGSTPRLLLEMMIEEIKGKKEYANVDYYIFDESPYLDKPHGVAYDDLMTHLFIPADVDEKRVHEMSKDNYASYDDMIDAAGGIDLMVLGLGPDGHFCSNVPYFTKLDAYSYEIDRKELCKVNPNYKDNPTYPFSYTMGPVSCMKAKQLVLIVNGKHKAEILKKTLEGEVSNEIPASVLKLHPNFVVICDKEAAELL